MDSTGFKCYPQFSTVFNWIQRSKMDSTGFIWDPQYSIGFNGSQMDSTVFNWDPQYSTGFNSLLLYLSTLVKQVKLHGTKSLFRGQSKRISYVQYSIFCHAVLISWVFTPLPIDHPLVIPGMYT